MYVCICRAVTDGQIQAAVDDGAASVGDLRRMLGVGGQCGRCARAAKTCLAAALAEQTCRTGFGPAGDGADDARLPAPA
ncbi:MAG: bacterioferritin [Gammaproteobacteria bacterium]|nr:bacterioferritin [Gammaproteobacteria bacterium]